MMWYHCSGNEFFLFTLLKISVCCDLIPCSLTEVYQGLEESYLLSYSDRATPKVTIICWIFPLLKVLLFRNTAHSVTLREPRSSGKRQIRPSVSHLGTRGVKLWFHSFSFSGLEWGSSEFRPPKVPLVPTEQEFGREGESHFGGLEKKKSLAFTGHESLLLRSTGRSTITVSTELTRCFSNWNIWESLL
jgi:hypothetical protein